MFQFIEANIFKFHSASFTTDFEQGLRSGLQKIYPDAELRGCWFHYIQALRRKASKTKNFMSGIRKDKQSHKIFNKFFVLPLLRPAFMENAFGALSREASEFPYFMGFVNYFKKQWISKVCLESISIHFLYILFNQDLSKQFSLYKKTMRTTSLLEAYNKKLGENLPKNGHFFKFCNALLDEEYNSTVNFCSALDGETWQIFERPKAKFEKRDEFIYMMTKKLDRGKITPTEFVNQLTSKLYGFSQFSTAVISDVSSTSEDEMDFDNAQQEENKIILTCAICFESPRNILLQPCNHCKMCSDCFSKLCNDSLKNNNELLCPFCRQIIKNSCHIYL